MPTKAEEDAFMRTLLAGMDPQSDQAASARTKTASTNQTRQKAPATRQTTPTHALSQLSPRMMSPAKRVLAPVDSFGGGSDMDWDAFDEWEQAQLAQPPKPKTLPTPSYSKEELTRCVVDSVADGGSIKNVTATVAESDEQIFSMSWAHFTTPHLEG
ncbi:hypothetical protein EXIGLDRAFT_838688 [Exidia glandulosa HHB12029]|uniref:Uncharacterized protein n=1 Tax=Exidia glandulosa HHB12029 TaxID=1314781 RepID=A0A165FK77_EXIGL|nr:hypothetical protein EXIGLDRAFT_838688 [Exidia glandulosa HHB12029]